MPPGLDPVNKAEALQGQSNSIGYSLKEPVVINGWSRLPRETDQQWAAFLVFRDSAYPEGPYGPFLSRSLKRTAQEIGLSHAHLLGWSASSAWFARAGEYDREIDTAKFDKSKSAMGRMHDRHYRKLAKLAQLVEIELDKAISRAESDPTTPTMKPSELGALMDLVIKHDRLLHGQHTEHVKVDAVDLENASLEELEVLHMTIKSIEKKGLPSKIG